LAHRTEENCSQPERSRLPQIATGLQSLVHIISERIGRRLEPTDKSVIVIATAEIH
jgi:hypothetical protein